MTPGAIFCYKRHGQIRRARLLRRGAFGGTWIARPVSLADGQVYGADLITITDEEIEDGSR